MLLTSRPARLAMATDEDTKRRMKIPLDVIVVFYTINSIQLSNYNLRTFGVDKECNEIDKMINYLRAKENLYDTKRIGTSCWTGT